MAVSFLFDYIPRLSLHHWNSFIYVHRSIPLRCSQLLNYSDDKKNKKDEDRYKKEDKDDDEKKMSSADRLNKLLASMQTDEGLTRIKKIEVTKAVGKKHRQEKLKTRQQEEEKKPKDIVEAAKGVAELMGDKSKQTESELLSKLLGSSTTSADNEVKDENKELSLRDIIVGMKIDRTPAHKIAQTRGQYVRNAMEDGQKSQRQPRRPKTDRLPREPHPSTGSVNLFGEAPLGIFKNKEELVESPDILKTWEYLNKKELKLSVTHPPANYFEKMVLWTAQGKLWKFPIDNEQGLDEEAKIDFSEHIFMEQHLEGWCPTKGPVRHFMELVCVGLSKNHYFTAQEKKEHILWYRNYFEDKKEMLKELIVSKEDIKDNKKSLEGS